MRKIELSYALTAAQHLRARQPFLLRNPMMDVLHAVQGSGSISGAARELDLSYRHVWGQLKDWETALGQGLVFWERGQAARLTPFGERLLAAERLAQARLGPQMDNLRAELERAFSQVLDAPAQDSAHPVITLYASHDHALTELLAFTAQAPQHQRDGAPLHLDIHFCGSVDAIRALNEGRCKLAGFPMQPLAAAGSLSARTYRPLLRPGLHKIIGFTRRWQGLMVAPGNPLPLQTMADVAPPPSRIQLWDWGLVGTSGFVLVQAIEQTLAGSLVQPPLTRNGANGGHGFVVGKDGDNLATFFLPITCLWCHRCQMPVF